MKIKAVFRFAVLPGAESAELVVPLVPGAGLQRHYRRRRYPFREVSRNVAELLSGLCRSSKPATSRCAARLSAASAGTSCSG